MPASNLLKELHEIEGSFGAVKKNKEQLACLYIEMIEAQGRVNELVKRMDSEFIKSKTRIYLPHLKKNVAIRSSHFVSVTKMSPKDHRMAASPKPTGTTQRGTKVRRTSERRSTQDRPR